MIPRYRYIDWENDCWTYECLMCREQFSFRASDLNFCPECGVAFEGDGLIEGRDPSVPRWVYSRYGNFNHPKDLTELLKKYEEKIVPVYPDWQIQTRMVIAGEPGKWEDECKIENVSAMELRRQMHSMKDDAQADDDFDIVEQIRAFVDKPLVHVGGSWNDKTVYYRGKKSKKKEKK